MNEPASSLACAGCGAPATPTAAVPAPVRCARARPGDDIDHVLRRTLDPEQIAYPDSDESNPFLRYRHLLHSRHVAAARGGSEATWRSRVEQLDRAIADVDGRGFAVTPSGTADGLATRLGLAPGRLWIKDETGNVSGSHKARHLMGILLYLEASNALRPDTRLAIASCGNAALAAAVVARAVELPLEVFVPPWADAHVVARLRELGAQLSICEREPNTAGDPCYRRFREAVSAGAVPFCCQGPDNGLAIEGGASIAWELIDALGGRALDRIFVQVGGGALASACALGFADAVRLGRIDRSPRLHAVQTAGGFPLARAYDRLAARLIARWPGAPVPDAANREPVAEYLAAPERVAAVVEELRTAATHRSEFMWPWDVEPKSVATSILDDETYDWRAVVEVMLLSGGWPVVVDEPTLVRAHELGRETTGIDVDPTGTAGLAGLLHELSSRARFEEETIAVLFTGASRRGPR